MRATNGKEIFTNKILCQQQIMARRVPVHYFLFVKNLSELLLALKYF